MDAPLNSTSRGSLRLGHAASSQLRCVLADVAELVEEARLERDLSPLAAIGLGQMLGAAAMLTRLVAKRPMRLLIDAQGDGPLGSIRAEADTLGHLRGLVTGTHAGDEHLIVGTPDLGNGTLRVVRQPENQDSYESKVQLVGGGIARNVAHYLDTSEQVRSAVLLGAQARPDGIVAAGGLIVQAMPDADSRILAELEEAIGELGGVSGALEAGGAMGLMQEVLARFEPEVLHEASLRLTCDCARERFVQHLRALAERQPDVITDGEDIEVQCSFCGANYRIPPAELGSPLIH